MKSKRNTTIAALVAALALTAVAAATASAALPEFTGTYPNAIKITFAQPVRFETEAVEAITCEAASAEGTITGAKTLTAKFKFSSCGYKGERLKCNEIKTEEMKSALVYISKARKEVGIDLNQAAGKSGIFAPQFTCEGHRTEKFEGGVIAPITPLNTKAKSFALVFSQHLGAQSPAKYENEEGRLVTSSLQDFFAGSSLVAIGMEGTGTMATALETEVKA